jgi:1,4-alpha-glucan branching enzyme
MPDHDFAVWAPLPQRVRVDVDGTLHEMARGDDAWWRATVPATPDSRYGCVLDDDPTVLPDPRSPRQPDGVHERSQLWDPATASWTDGDWAGRAIAGGVIYELHTGTFTGEGTFDAAIGKLDYLVDLGVDFVELMPVNSFSGTHGWGYDGVLWYAVHALVDTTAIHLLEELATETDELASQLGRPLSLIGESDLNDPRLITARDRGGYGLTAQWDDDIHHAIHSAVSGERQGYYADFGSMRALAQTLQNGYFHAGTYSSFRGRRHGRPLDKSVIPATRLLAYTTTHDQVGNRAFGDRPSQNLDFGQLAVKAALAIGSPYTAMLFMGEEWGSSRPFQFFTSHPEPELARATAEGRKAEFAHHGWDADEIPDPQGPQTFLRSKLDWDEVELGEHDRLRRTYRDLIALRHNEPDLADPWLDHLSIDYDEERRWIALRRGSLVIAANLGPDPVRVPVSGEVVLAWEQPAIEDRASVLARHSFAIVRTPTDSRND